MSVASSKSSQSRYRAPATNDDDDDDNSLDSNDETDSVTSSSVDNSSMASSVDEVKLKLAQMKRANKNKVPQSKLLMKFKNFISPEQRAQNEANKRIDTGLRSCLMLHSPVELSALCGVLELKPLQRANISIDLIIAFTKEQDGNFLEKKVLKVVNNMWEGALFEYLKSIGHPIITSQDPKQTVMKIWRQGGFQEYSETSFTPHYLQKRVVTRHDAEQSPDIAVRQERLKAAEVLIKYTERELFEEHNYTNALTFFQQLGEMRRQEAEFRDYLINQLELVRSQISRAESNVKLAHEMTGEGEERYLRGVHELTEKLSVYEVAYEHEMQGRVNTLQDIASLEEIVRSMAQVFTRHRQVIHSSSPRDKAANFRQFLQSSSSESKWKTLPPQTLQRYNRHLQNIYRTVTCEGWAHRQVDEILTTTITDQERRLTEQQKVIDKLNETLLQKDQKIRRLEEEVKRREREIALAASELTHRYVTNLAVRKEAWQMGIRMTGRVNHLEDKLRSIEAILKTAIQITSNKLLISFCQGINNVLEIVPAVTMTELYEGGEMRVEDRLSELVRQDEIRVALLSGGTKTKKKKKVIKKGGAKKSSGGAKKSSGGTKKTTGATTTGSKKSTTGSVSGKKPTTTTSGSKTAVKKKAAAPKKKK
jgi:hypothetical protein